MESDSSLTVAHEALLEGVRIAGSQGAFARLIGVSQQAVSLMIAKKKGLSSADYVPLAVQGTGIPAERWRPDIFVIAPAPAPAAPPLIERGLS
ncbi:YdaS family helix-turn-helix protein [Sphingomonas sp. LK11]|uniref:YdaS family helix-turn-helix protein n=1 Tax=Sphingomonas sp. LK11 TaxID=1390395 RepID=UPI0009F9F617|nr:YdaS family helix-turn-helix protein [Sphingomonas sp. LK11]